MKIHNPLTGRDGSKSTGGLVIGGLLAALLLAFVGFAVIGSLRSSESQSDGTEPPTHSSSTPVAASPLSSAPNPADPPPPPPPVTAPHKICPNPPGWKMSLPPTTVPTQPGPTGTLRGRALFKVEGTQDQCAVVGFQVSADPLPAVPRALPWQESFPLFTLTPYTVTATSDTPLTCSIVLGDQVLVTQTGTDVNCTATVPN